jgi:hypothetical protein
MYVVLCLFIKIFILSLSLAVLFTYIYICLFIALHLRGRHANTWAMSPAFLHWLFLDRVWLYAWASLDFNPPTCAFCVAGMTDVHHHAQFICWDRVSPSFFVWAGLKPWSSQSPPPDLFSWDYDYKALHLASYLSLSIHLICSFLGLHYLDVPQFKQPLLMDICR